MCGEKASKTVIPPLDHGNSPDAYPMRSGDDIVFFGLDSNGVILHCGGAAESVLGISAQHTVGMNWREVVFPSKSHHDLLTKAGQKLFLGELDEAEFSVEVETPARKLKKLIVYLWAQNNDAGTRAVSGILVDVTALRGNEQAYKAIFENAPLGIMRLDEHGVITNCNEKMLAVLGTDREKLLGFNTVQGLKNEGVRRAVLTAMSGRLGVYEGEYASVTGTRATTMRMLFNPVTPGRAPSQAIVIFEDVAERTRFEAALLESENRHRTIFENSPLGMVRYSAEGEILDCNEPFVRLMGSPRETLIGFNPAVRHSDERVRSALRKALSGEQFVYEREFTSHTGGKTLFLRAVLNPVNPGVSPTEVISTVEDIGERVLIEKELEAGREELALLVHERTSELEEAYARLRDNERKLRRIVEHSRDLFYTYDREKMLTYASPRARDILDCDPEEARVAWDEFLTDNPINAQALKRAEKALDTGERQPPYEVEIKTRAGRTLWGEVSESPVKEKGAVVAMVGAVRDVTERKKAEEAVRRSKAGLDMAEKLAHLGSWTWFRTTGVVYFSRETGRIHGLRGDGAVTADAFRDLIHPGDLRFFRRAMAKALRSGDHFELEYRIVRNQGEERIVHAIGETTLYENGGPAVMSGSIQDITERKHAEDQLELAKRVFDNAREGVLMTDARGTIQFVNKGFTRITGYTPEEAIGKNPRVLKSDRHEDGFYTDMWRALAKEDYWEGEIWNRRKNGEAYPEWLSITAIRDARGRPYRYVSVFHDTTEIWKKEELLKHQANHDALTGLPNRNLFIDRLSMAMDRVRSNGDGLVVILMDLDSFQTINDALGHTEGDILLHRLAERLTLPEGWKGTVARPGGDEFLLLLEGMGANDAPRITRWLFECLEKPFSLQGRDFFVTASLGVTLFPGDGETALDLMKNADMALHHTKQLGRNTYSLYRPELNARISRRLELENDLRQALGNDEIVVYYQPQADIRTRRIVGMEALVRWRRGGKIISPADFIPLAEETGLIVPIGEWVLRESCRKLKELLDAGAPPMRVSVNLSAKQFAAENLEDMTARALADADLPPNLLELEITESALIEDADQALAIAGRLRDMGPAIALDDFGTGYSSLSYLRRFPIQTLKIDKSFVDDIPDDMEANAVVNAVIAMARSLDLSVVAEGVETEEQLWYLRRQNCDIIQGYFLSKPLPDKEIKDFVLDCCEISALP